jgi:hypothetical protein
LTVEVPAFPKPYFITTVEVSARFHRTIGVVIFKETVLCIECFVVIDPLHFDSAKMIVDHHFPHAVGTATGFTHVIGGTGSINVIEAHIKKIGPHLGAGRHGHNKTGNKENKALVLHLAFSLRFVRSFGTRKVDGPKGIGLLACFNVLNNTLYGLRI